ncbi:hypothetical protein [Jannaschia sp. M317]|uniref:hypothetical protein n=1 Tax=Jannaschia sp. M317 TaxID=2867011 RepID=UPI0021A6D580|nr:hypothetical protein [Jannaschia sp. M317]UWQ19200.1 hypothetical protein K3551_08005 [Jannaschia sp. M317]
MRPEIALDLSLDGIAVLSRAPEGGWWREGAVRLDTPDMPDRLADLRDRAQARVGADAISILILPDSQLLYTSLERDDRRPEETIRALLKGRTPYPVEDLTFDYVERGDRLQVAVVALETLLEAETFAADYGFRPVVIMANPKDPAYPGLPNFGKTGIAAELLAGAPLEVDLPEGFAALPAPRPTPKAPKSEPPVPLGHRPASSETVVAALPESAPEAPVAQPPATPTPAEPPTVDAAETLAQTKPAPKKAPAAPKPKAATPPPTPLDVPASEDAPLIVPGFSTSRKAAPEPTARAASGERLDRVTRRLSTPPAAPKPATAPKVAPPPTVAPKTPATNPALVASRDAPAAPTVAVAKGDADAAPEVTPALAEPQPEVTGKRPGVVAARALSTLTDKMQRLREKGRVADPKQSEEARIRQEEAAALALPGLAREKAATPARPGGARLGLALTVGLLILLFLVAVGSLLLGGDDLAEVPVAPQTPAVEATAVLPPVAEPTPDETTPEVDIAALLPAPGATPVAAVPETDPVATPPEVVALADPLLRLPEAAPTGLPDEQILPIVAPDIAAPPGLDLAPTLDTTPSTFIERFEAAGEFTALPAPVAPADATAEDIYVASIDPDIAWGDAVALPRAEPPADGVAIQTNPAPAGTTFATDAQTGLVEATPEGTLAPGGYTVVLGRPDVFPVQRATSASGTTEAEDALENEAQQILRRVRPVPRPEDAAELVERTRNGGFTRAELTRVRPRARPDAIVQIAATAQAARSAAEQAAAASLAAATDAAVAEAQADAPVEVAAVVQSGPVSPLALPASERPRSRPRSVERDAARIVTQRREQAAAAPAAPATPAARSVDSGSQATRAPGGSVARAATERNVLRLNRINLIGVYGRPNARRALVRLANGRYVKVEVGDRLDRGRVTAIGDGTLSYQRGGNNVVLRMPQA